MSLGGAYADDKDPDVAKEAKIIRNAMTRLHAEISRSINFYRAQQSGTAPARIFLCGGTSNLPYLREFFSEKFQLPIEYFNPLRNVTVTPQRQRGRGGQERAPARRTGRPEPARDQQLPDGVEPAPSSVINAQKIAARRPYFIAAGLCLLLALAGWWLYFQRAADIQAGVLEEINAKVADMRRYEDKLQQAQGGHREDRRQRRAARRRLVEDREFWPRVINEINPKPAREVRLDHAAGTHRSAASRSLLGDPAKPLWQAAPAPGRARARPGVARRRGPMIDGLHVRGLYLVNPDQDRIVYQFVEQPRQVRRSSNWT